MNRRADLSPSRSTTRRAAPRPAGAKGYVLFIVLVVGVAAGLAAASLVSTRGGAQTAAMHTELADRSQAYAEAGMQRAIFYLNDVLGNFGDFDAALDTNLDASCGGPGPVTPESTDLRPDTGPPDADVLIEWSEGFEEMIDGKAYSCVSVGGATAPANAARDQAGGRYCVRFEDDDDDGVDTDLWKDTTGNNELSTGCDTSGSSGGCYEGPPGADTACGNHNNGENNPLRDRNRAIWVVSIGIFPDVPFDQATHRTTIRRMHMAPRFPTFAGLSVKGSVITNSGSAQWFACSDVASVAIDGIATAHTKTNVCASGYSRAHEWNNFSHCRDVSACANVAYGDGLSITPLAGELETPGPRLDDLPPVWDEANEWVDFNRSCVFWVDNGVPANPDHGLSGGEHSLWVWDARAERGPGGVPCGTFETAAGEKAAMPGPPNPAATPGGGDACADATDPSCWAGCWTPLLFMNGGVDLIVPGSTLTLPTNGTVTATSAPCFQPGWRLGQGGSGHFLFERDLVAAGQCNWKPVAMEAWYDVCSSSSNCYFWGRDDGISHGGTNQSDPLNQRLASSGINTFPPGTRLRKPNWQAECTVNYPPESAGLSTPTTPHNCSTCTGASFPVLINPDSTGTVFHRGQNAALRGPQAGGGGQDQIWFRINSQAEAKAVPAGVYYFSRGFSLTGSNFAGASAGHANAGTRNPALPHEALDQYPLVTIMNDEGMNLQFGGYSFGIGQDHAGEGNGGIKSIWGRYPTWITGATLTMQGQNDTAVAGSVYAKNGATWPGGGEYFVFGELYTDGDFILDGGAQFYWLYQVKLDDSPVGGFSGVNATQTYIAQ